MEIIEERRILHAETLKSDETHLVLCSRCSEPLSSPIFLTINGNICNDCKSDTEQCMRNTFMEHITAYVLVDCKHKAVGCEKMIPCKKYRKHLSDCEYAFTKCSFCEESLISKLALFDHFKTKHEITPLEDCDHELSKENPVTFLSFIFKQTCLIAIITLKDKVYRLAICHKGETYLGNLKINFTVLHDGDDYFMSLPISKIWQPKFITLPTELKGDSSVRLIFKFHDDDSQKKESEAFISAVTCPVCLEFLQKPIDQCMNGHSICKSCKSNIDTCPICKILLKQTARNLVLEQMLDDLPVPCKNANHGCLFEGKLKDMHFHTSKCSYLFFKCMLKNCKYKGIKSDLLEHVVTKHQIVANFSKIESNTYDLQHFIVDFGEVFLLEMHSQKALVSWSVKMLGNKEGVNPNYKFQIDILNKSDESVIRLNNFCSVKDNNPALKAPKNDKRSISELLRDCIEESFGLVDASQLSIGKQSLLKIHPASGVSFKISIIVC